MILKTKQKLALARSLQIPVLGMRRVLGRDSRTRVRRHSINWDLDLQEGIDFAIYLTGRFEHRTVRAIAGLVEAGDTVIDIGANIGAHTLPLARLVGAAGRVYALEPTRFAYGKLRANIDLNPDLSARIAAEQVMLTVSSEAPLEKELYSSWPLAGDLQGHAKHGGRPMPTDGAVNICLTEFVESRNIGKVKLLKLDVDGFEVDVLRGGLAFLKRQKPVVVMELAPYTLEERAESLEALLDILGDADYSLAHEATGKSLSRDPAVLRRLVPDGGSINIVAKASP